MPIEMSWTPIGDVFSDISAEQFNALQRIDYVHHVVCLSSVCPYYTVCCDKKVRCSVELRTLVKLMFYNK